MPVAPAIFGLPDWGSRLIFAAFVVAAAVVILAVLTRVGPRVGERWARGAEMPRARQRRTAAALVVTAGRYAVAVAALIAIAVVLAGGGGVGAVGGGALVVLVLGFAAQRLLTDVIAGFFILFEGQYGVGDYVRLEPSGIAGVVQELGVRTTVVHALNGDVCHVPNGQITGVRRVPRGWRAMQVRLVTRDPERLARVVADVASMAPAGGGRFLRAPRVGERRELGGGLTALRVVAEVAPSLEWLVDDYLVTALKARAGDLLVTEPIVVDLDAETVERYQAGLALP
ncbi:MAG: mechanosensitive ion channel domain-containing protein [Actinomycetota bacterium]